MPADGLGWPVSADHGVFANGATQALLLLLLCLLSSWQLDVWMFAWQTLSLQSLITESLVWQTPMNYPVLCCQWYLAVSLNHNILCVVQTHIFPLLQSACPSLLGSVTKAVSPRCWHLYFTNPKILGLPGSSTDNNTTYLSSTFHLRIWNCLTHVHLVTACTSWSLLFLFLQPGRLRHRVGVCFAP